MNIGPTCATFGARVLLVSGLPSQPYFTQFPRKRCHIKGQSFIDNKMCNFRIIHSCRIFSQGCMVKKKKKNSFEFLFVPSVHAICKH